MELATTTPPPHLQSKSNATQSTNKPNKPSSQNSSLPQQLTNKTPDTSFNDVWFMTQDIPSITDVAYASLLLKQKDFQASAATLKVPGLCPLNTVITGSTDTLGMEIGRAHV